MTHKLNVSAYVQAPVFLIQAEAGTGHAYADIGPLRAWLEDTL